MLNINSPTVQAMLGNTPQGFGNLPPVYYGSSPVIQTSEPVNTGLQTPFPSPKEMLTQGGQQTIYQPTTFTPNNIVGAYNPGYNAAFAGYTNPYMGYGAYPGYGYQAPPPDQDSQNRLETATNNGLTYDEQLKEERDLYQAISKIVGKNLGMSEEEIQEYSSKFCIYNKYPKQEEIPKKRLKKRLHIQLCVGDTIVADMNPETIEPAIVDNSTNVKYVEYMKQSQYFHEINGINKHNMLYNQAVERQLDKMDMMEFFNVGSGLIVADTLQNRLYKQRLTQIGDLYDQNNFRENLLKNNGFKSRRKMKAIERFANRYGVMPNGRPVSPGHDPEIASSFTYNSATGQYDVTPPNFIKNSLDEARSRFIKSLDQ